MSSPTSRPPAPSARHGEVLLRKTPAIEDLVPALSLLSEKLGRSLAAPLARMTGGEPPVVRVGMPIDCRLAAIEAEIETFASHGLLGMGPQGLPILLTIEAPPVFGLVDRAFGGRGLVPDALPDVLPISADLLLARLDTAVAEALDSALAEPSTSGDGRRVRPLRRNTSLRQLAPFDGRTDLLQITLEVEEAGAAPWTFALSFPLATLAAALAPPPRQRPIASRKAPGGPDEEPFASLPLTVTAVLVDMDLPFSRLATLQAGDVLPVAVARAIPLQVAGRTIATGTVGEVEDRVAVQVRQAF